MDTTAILRALCPHCGGWLTIDAMFAAEARNATPWRGSCCCCHICGKLGGH